MLIVGMFIASMTLMIKSTWPWNSSGVLDRPALYSVYSSERKVGVSRSKATATWLGFCCRIMVSSIDVKPCTALVCWPVSVTKVSGGKA